MGGRSASYEEELITARTQAMQEMSDIEKIQLFEQRKIRTAWDEDIQEWFFSIVDVCGVLTEQPDYDHAKNYWKVLKFRLIKEGNESVTNCNQLKMVSPKDGKRYSTDVADMALMFRIIESIPSKKAEPFKIWMARVAAERINQAIDPERSIDQAIADYRRLGYSEAWINRRIKSIEIRKGLTDEWKLGGVTKEVDFAFLTDLMSKTWSGMTSREYKKYKGLTKENLRDNMTNMELLLNALAEETATENSKQRTRKAFQKTLAWQKKGQKSQNLLGGMLRSASVAVSSLLKKQSTIFSHSKNFHLLNPKNNNKASA